MYGWLVTRAHVSRAQAGRIRGYKFGSVVFNLPFCGYRRLRLPASNTVGKAMEWTEWRLSVNAVQQLLATNTEAKLMDSFRLTLFGNANVRRAKLLNLTWDLGTVEWHWERSYISKTNEDYGLKIRSVPRAKLFTGYYSAIARNISRKLRA